MDPAGFDGRRNLVADVDVARQTLLDARSRLDLTLAALPEIDGDEAMATPALLLLLVGAVKAKERLGRLEDLLRDLVEER